VFLGNAGTAVRFGACLSLLSDGELVIDGEPRMRQRPIGALVEALAQLGVTARYLGEAGYPPLGLSRGSTAGDRVRIDGSLSSQYASGLMLVAPRLSSGLTVELTGALVSRPYLEMTAQMMRQAGAEVEADWDGDPPFIRVAPGGYRGGEPLVVEADWSTASFLLAAGELSGRRPRIPNLVEPARSLQGDAAFAQHLERLRGDAAGGEHVIDLSDTPDLIAPLAALALFASHPVQLRNVAHARTKECDRIAVLAEQLRRVGAEIDEHEDGLTLRPLRPLTTPAEPVSLEPAADHRMAMAFGLVGLKLPHVTVLQPECVSKSFPAFWSALARFTSETGDA